MSTEIMSDSLAKIKKLLGLIPAYAYELYFIVITNILAILLTRKNSQFLVVVQKGL